MQIHLMAYEPFTVITHEYLISQQEAELYLGRSMVKSFGRKAIDFIRALFGLQENGKREPLVLSRLGYTREVEQTQVERDRELRDAMLRVRDEITSSLSLSTVDSGFTLLLPTDEIRQKILAYTTRAFDEHYAPCRQPRTLLNKFRHDEHFLKTSEAVDAIVCDFLREEKYRPSDIAWLQAVSGHVHKKLKEIMFTTEDKHFDAGNDRMLHAVHLHERERLHQASIGAEKVGDTAETELPCEFERWLANGGTATGTSFSNGPRYGIVTSAGYTASRIRYGKSMAALHHRPRPPVFK